MCVCALAASGLSVSCALCASRGDTFPIPCYRRGRSRLRLRLAWVIVSRGAHPRNKTILPPFLFAGGALPSFAQSGFSPRQHTHVPKPSHRLELSVTHSLVCASHLAGWSITSAAPPRPPPRFSPSHQTPKARNVVDLCHFQYISYHRSSRTHVAREEINTVVDCWPRSLTFAITTSFPRLHHMLRRVGQHI